MPIHCKLQKSTPWTTKDGQKKYKNYSCGDVTIWIKPTSTFSENEIQDVIQNISIELPAGIMLAGKANAFVPDVKKEEASQHVSSGPGNGPSQQKFEAEPEDVPF